METRSKVSGGSEPLKKAIRAVIWQYGHQKISNVSACKAQGNHHEIRIAFFERDYCYKPNYTAGTVFSKSLYYIFVFEFNLKGNWPLKQRLAMLNSSCFGL